MTLKPIILEMGMGADVHGGNHTKAALRAVSDAIRHSSLSLFSSLKRHPNEMKIEVTISSTEPDKIDKQAVADALPYGTIEVLSVKGGLSDRGMGGLNETILVNAAVKVFLHVKEGEVQLEKRLTAT